MAKTRRTLTSVDDALSAATKRGPEPAEPEEQQGHQRRASGYIRADGTELRRRSLMLTDEQSKRLDVACAMAGHGGNISAYVVEKLRLDG